MTLPARRQKVRSGIERGGPVRSARHLKFIRSFCCAVCGESNQIEAAHVRLWTDGSLGYKPSDAWALPLDSGCHARQHQIGEKTFWRGYGKNPHKLAIEFARQSPDPAIKEFVKTMKDRWI